mmetsp:Transcript_31845/g.74943  ORF Transcript_31845/g.74943 Transcript_31845/m.74943 type:complete len:144 (+) Transcript_31845:1189-1620(+)
MSLRGSMLMKELSPSRYSISATLFVSKPLLRSDVLLSFERVADTESTWDAVTAMLKVCLPLHTSASGDNKCSSLLVVVFCVLGQIEPYLQRITRRCKSLVAHALQFLPCYVRRKVFKTPAQEGEAMIILVFDKDYYCFFSIAF